MIPSKEKVASALEKHFTLKLYPLSGKQIFFSGKMANGKEILVCTPKSKLYPAGHGWVDITTIQFEMLDKVFRGILAFRLEGNKVYYLCFQDLKKSLTDEAMVNNAREGDHWKLHLLPDHIKIINNKNQLAIKPNGLDRLLVL